jgi:CHAT domain-containing protein
MEFLGQLRADLASEPLRRALIADRARIYADQVVALLRRGRTDDAFAVADAGRSRGLVDHLATARTKLSTADRPSSAEGEQLLREIDVVLRLLRDAERVPPRERSAGAAANGDALSRRLDEARGRYEAFLHRTARAPSRRSTLLGATTVDPGRVRAAIGPDERVLEYMVAEDRIVLFVASRDSIHAIERPADLRAITERIRVLRETWGTRDAGWQVALPAARALYRELLAPAREAGLLEGARRLVVVPHGVLSQVPFAALRGGADRWLVEDFELLYVPSAAALPALRAPHAPLPRTSALAAFAPFPRELPATRDEARSVQRGAAGATLAMGATATEAAVRSALAEGRVVHVATHGVMNSRNPLFSRVELARGRGAPQGDDDGRLEVHELLGMTVASPLVFLSGCETSAFQAWLDDPVRGTDHATLAQAFLQAGAENVAGTLWRIDDGGAAAFAAAFHERLRRADPVAALAAAQRRFIADAGYGNPYYWASYLVVGSGRLPASAEKSRGPSVSYGRQAVREPLPLEP